MMTPADGFIIILTILFCLPIYRSRLANFIILSFIGARLLRVLDEYIYITEAARPK